MSPEQERAAEAQEWMTKAAADLRGASVARMRAECFGASVKRDAATPLAR